MNVQIHRATTARPRLRAWTVFVLSNALAFTSLVSLSLSLPDSVEPPISLVLFALGGFVVLFAAPYLAATIAFTIDARSPQHTKPALAAYLMTIVSGALISVAGTWWFSQIASDPYGGLGVIFLIPYWYVGAAIVTAILYLVVRSAYKLKTASRLP